MYKFLVTKNGKLKSHYGNKTWTVGRKYTVKGELERCSNGFHASAEPLDALGYVHGDVLAVVEGSGEYLVEPDKCCFKSMKIIAAYDWTKEDSVALAVYAAELVIDIFEQSRPGDNRARKAIEAAKEWLDNPSQENAAYATHAANAAYAAAAAAYYAAYYAANAIAYYAANAASNAAYGATAASYASYSASRAASAAANAAYYTGGANELRASINQWIKDRISNKEMIGA